MQCFHGVTGLWARLVLETQRANGLAVGDYVEDDGALITPFLGDLKLVKTVLLQQFRSAHLDSLAVNCRFDPNCG